MKYNKIFLLATLSLFLFGNAALSKDPDYPSPDKKKSESGYADNNHSNKTTSNCAQATDFTDLDINNVRARIMNGGDMWWDRGLGIARYEVPKGTGRQANFAGSVWIGGYDPGGNLKVTAQTYRQGGNDYWPGPLNATATTDVDICLRWDQIWKINLTDVLDFIAAYNDPTTGGVNFNIYDPKWQAVREWPGYKNSYLDQAFQDDFTADKTAEDFAPFVDVDSNGVYNPDNGDYPRLRGDQLLFWIFNDAGAVKTQTNTPAVGMEVHGSAFGFLTNDQLNNATFYNYKLINRSTTDLDSVHIATFTDADLGWHFDDYVGCDTVRSLGILYNADAFDGSGLPSQYGSDIPMIGVDFFEGPDALRWNEDSMDFVMTELGMTSFVYFNNSGDVRIGDPQTGIEFYRYMTGSGRDGSRFTQTCNALDPSANLTRAVYWGDPSKPGNLETNWTECGCNNEPADKRFVHSSGPFELLPGADPIDVTIGVVWVDGIEYPCPSFSTIQLADDKAQELFDRNFQPITPPNAPELTIRELDEQLVIYLSNPAGSNNHDESYGIDFKEVSTKGQTLGYSDSECTYLFEGYKVFQVVDSSVSTGDIYNEDGTVNNSVARLAFQCDVKNGVSKISNFVESANSQSVNPHFEEQVKADGEDAGIRKSFSVTQDLFASGTNSNLVNYKRYYYIAVAYAYNNFKDFDGTPESQNTAYLESFKNGYNKAITSVLGIPNPAYTDMGNQIRAEYGDGVVVKVLEGKGNGGNFLVLSEDSENEALFGGNSQASNMIYEKGQGPIDVRVIDPIRVPAADFEVWILGENSEPGRQDTSRGVIAEEGSWFVKNLTTGDTIFSEQNLNSASDQILADYGLSMRITQVGRAGDDLETMGFLGDTIIFDEPNVQWLSGVQDMEGRIAGNWIRSGKDATEPIEFLPPCEYRDYEYPGGSWDDGQFLDPNSVYEALISGTWAPYALAANDPSCGFGVAFAENPYQNVDANSGYASSGYRSRRSVIIQKLQGIDIVMTPDRSKWSKCAVVEMHDVDSFVNGLGYEPAMYSEGAASKFNLRRHASLQRDPGPNGEPVYSDPVDYGTSWFPGYAINVETGERLNIFFGEDSYLASEHGRDMIWNPTDGYGQNGLGTFNPVLQDYDALFGGKHAIYVSRTKYDECALIIETLKDAEEVTSTSRLTDKSNLYGDVIWMGLPLLAQNFALESWADGLIPTPTRIRIRVDVPYQSYADNIAFEEINENPRYFFSTKDQTMINWSNGSQDLTDALLKRVRVVPNPYYAYSAYEWNRLDNRVKIINLPNRATVKIYSLDGVLIRTLTKDDGSSFIDWDLKNSAGISISGGAYLMHVQAEGIGETVLKWFAAIRPTDITTF